MQMTGMKKLSCSIPATSTAGFKKTLVRFGHIIKLDIHVHVPVYVASLTAVSRGSNFGLKATVNAQSIILPFTCMIWEFIIIMQISYVT